MNEQETIENLKNLFSEHELCLPHTDSLETLHIAIKALEKQIAKKVEKEPHFTIHRNPGFYYVFLCPNCNHVVEEYENKHIFPHIRNDFCNKCGQKIDWTVEK